MQISVREIQICIAFAICVVITVSNILIVVDTNTEGIVTHCLGLWEFLAVQSAVDCTTLTLFMLAMCCSDHTHNRGEISKAIAALTAFMTLGTLCFAGCGAIIYAATNEYCMNDIRQKAPYMMIASSILVTIDGISLITVTIVSVWWVCNVESRPSMATAQV